MKIAIVSLVWKRPEVFEMFAQGIHALKIPKDVQVQVFISGSEGSTSRIPVESHGFQYVEIPNQPLAKKANAPLRFAKKWDADYVLCMGSDDVLSPELFLLYIDIMRKGVDFMGVLDFYFYDTTTGKASYWGGYNDRRAGLTCGAGRVLSRRILELWNWSVWESKHNHILDNSMDEKLRDIEHRSCTFRMKDYDLYAVDIKSSTNMTPFELWPNTRYVKSELLTKKFPFIVCAE